MVSLRAVPGWTCRQQAPGSFVQAEALLPGRFLFQRPSQRCFLLHPSHPLFFPGAWTKPPGHPGLQQGWKENTASFLWVVSPRGDWKIQHSHSRPGSAAALGLVWEKEPAGFTAPVLCPSSHCSDPQLSTLCPPCSHISHPVYYQMAQGPLGPSNPVCYFMLGKLIQ